MAEAVKKPRRFNPTWDLYLMRNSGNALLARNVKLEEFLNKYFTRLSVNLKEHPKLSNEDIIDKYKNLWDKQGILRSYYNDSWGHKWACFPHNKKLNTYIDKIRKLVTNN